MEIQDIITGLRERFKELGVNVKGEQAMVAREGNNILSRVMCFHCGKYGHKVSECRNKNDGKPDVVPRHNGNNNQKGKFQGICSYSNKNVNHKSVCFKKKADAAAVRNELANAAAQNNNKSKE